MDNGVNFENLEDKGSDAENYSVNSLTGNAIDEIEAYAKTATSSQPKSTNHI